MRFRAQAVTWQEFSALTRRMKSDEAGLRRRLWRRLLREAAEIPFLEDIVTAHYCAFDRQTPLYVKALLVAAISYFVLPNKILPSSLLGLADEAAVLAAAVKAVSSHIKPEHKEAAQLTMARLRSA